MTDTLPAQETSPSPEPPRRRSTPALAVVAALAIVALAAVAIVAIRGNGGSTTVMGNRTGMPGSMMTNGTMMGNGSMMGHGPNSPIVAGAREIGVAAKSFSFSPAEIHVKAREDVTIVLTATDITHDFTVDELAVHVAANPGTAARGGLHAPATPGRYTFYCTVAGHRQAGMTGTLVVDPS